MPGSPEGAWTASTYEGCRNLDELFHTPERSPLHRANRFPVEFAREREHQRQREALAKALAEPPNR